MIVFFKIIRVKFEKDINIWYYMKTSGGNIMSRYLINEEGFHSLKKKYNTTSTVVHKYFSALLDKDCVLADEDEERVMSCLEKVLYLRRKLYHEDIKDKKNRILDDAIRDTYGFEEAFSDMKYITFNSFCEPETDPEYYDIPYQFYHDNNNIKNYRVTRPKAKLLRTTYYKNEE